ncbi:MAG TPA: hypothetical protein VED41_07485 [Solirubrobacteraceae bacterium]|nr:hypothetical protein [Solirubrobacteraceae bacterium]
MSAVGAAALIASLLTPWYEVGIRARAQVGASAHAASTIDAFGALHHLTVVLLVIGVLAMLDVTAPQLRRGGPVPGGAGGSVVLLGAVAAGLTLYRMIDLPTLAGEELALAVREGAWLALIGSVTMMLGGMWPRYVTSAQRRSMRPGTLSLN